MTDFSKIVSKERILIGDDTSNIKTKRELFYSMAETFLKSEIIKSVPEFLASLDERENQGSTYMGNYIAIPHGDSDTVKSSSLSICILNNPIEYSSYGESGLVKYIFMFAIEKSTAGTVYLKMLADLARQLMDENFIKKIESASNDREIVYLLSKKGREK
ncbi:PTS sugar transporter subunit IIA [Enterococcus hirae]|nr:PTS sugar transporter subunit IIA [Enterococcus hirae]